jgi:hypothetical protein
MIKKEIKQFVITQMKEANWCIEKVDGFNKSWRVRNKLLLL